MLAQSFASRRHGEMLGDHGVLRASCMRLLSVTVTDCLSRWADGTRFAGDWNKEKPWEGSTHVPLVCGGPSAQTQVVAQPVTTMDLAATWLEFASLGTILSAVIHWRG